MLVALLCAALAYADVPRCVEAPGFFRSHDCAEEDWAIPVHLPPPPKTLAPLLEAPEPVPHAGDEPIVLEPQRDVAPDNNPPDSSKVGLWLAVSLLAGVGLVSVVAVWDMQTM